MESKVGDVMKGKREGEREREREVGGDVREEEIMTLVFCLSFLVLFLGILIVNLLRLLFFALMNHLICVSLCTLTTSEIKLFR